VVLDLGPQSVGVGYLEEHASLLPFYQLLPIYGSPPVILNVLLATRNCFRSHKALDKSALKFAESLGIYETTPSSHRSGN
jgi:hypothetical protein